MIFGIIFLSLSIAAYIAGIAWIYWDIKNEERGRKNLNGVQCKKCRYLLKDKEGYNWCPNKTDDPDIELIRDCEWYAVKTNADCIRSMTDEELAWFFYTKTGCDHKCMHWKSKSCSSPDFTKVCGEVWLEWLQAESGDSDV